MFKNSSILILGGGSRLANAFSNIYPQEITTLSKEQCNILDNKSIEKAFKKYASTYVVNAAAITDIEFCETHSQQCFDINTLAAFNLSMLCKKYNKKFIHISSDYAVNPINVYGMSKYISEQIIDKDSLIIRTNFYDEKTYVVKELLKNKPILSYANITFNPISLNTLVKEIYNKKDKKGIYNIYTKDKITVHKFALLFCKVFNVNKSLIEKSSFKNGINKAKRPLSSYIKPDITVSIEKDLADFKQYLEYEN